MKELLTGIAIEFEPCPEITQERLNAYAKASGDNNKIHLDEAVAKAMGLPGIIAHGMLSAAFISHRALKAISQSETYKSFQISHFQTRFKSMVFLGDQVSVGGVVKQATANLLVMELHARNQKGEVLTLGNIEFRFG
jgi:acyl dehydratase